MDDRFEKSQGVEAFTGNELLLKGALEAGIALMTGYPGSPVSEVFDAASSISDLLNFKGIVAQMANNEALAAARLNGARMADLRALAIMKSVGMHVAADGLAIGNLAECKKPNGGAVVVVGDDPWNETTQINSDSRFLSKHLHMPTIEPSTFQELKDWLKDAFELSGACDLYLTYVITTNQADGGGAVLCRPNIYPSVNHHQKTVLSSQSLPVENTVMIPPHTSWREATLGARFERLLENVRARGLNKIVPSTAPDAPRVGFVSAGLPYCYLTQALREMGVDGVFPILKFGITFPLDPRILREFAQNVDHIFVVEEKRDFLESQIAVALQKMFQEGKIAKLPAVWGKSFPDQRDGIPAVRGLNASVLIEKLAPLFEDRLVQLSARFGKTWSAAYSLVKETSGFAVSIPVRTPTFCPGCPHRDSATVTKALKNDLASPVYMKKYHKQEPVDVIFHGESGCHSMLQFEPNIGLMQDYSGMGLGGGTGSGMDPFITNKQVVFLGDSTFFHSGMVAVSDSIKNNQDITYIILDNKTTAMTGHQPTPGTDNNLTFGKTFAQDIEQLIRGMSRDSIPIFRVNPAYRDSYRKLVEEVVLKPGVKVIIADKECGITYHRRIRREKKKIVREQGFIPVERAINISPEVCEFCLECTNSTGCPGLAIEDTLHGPKIVTDKSLCVSDGACTKGKVCPSFEEVIIERKRPAPAPSIDSSANLPDPVAADFESNWFCYTAGVGGMGAGVVTSILVRAGLLQGYQVVFSDKKGLAIRNGGVYGHVVFSKKEQVVAPLVPYGRADLLLGIDLLEAARGLDPKMNLRTVSPAHTASLVNTHKMPTIKTLMGKEDFDASELEKAIRKYSRPGHYFGLDFALVSEEYFGTKVYCNVLLLGAAYQKGYVPVSLSNMLLAIKASVPPQDVAENLKAFELGRRVVAHPEPFGSLTKGLPTFWEVLDDKTSLLSNEWFGGRSRAQTYSKMVKEAVRWMDFAEEGTGAKLAQYVYDLVRFGGLDYARRYIVRVWSTYQKDKAERGWAATQAVLHNLYRAMIIKDEVYVAKLLTSEEKYRRDRERFRIDPSRGDKITYVHLNRPQFTVFGFDVEFNLRARDWMLKVMRHFGFLRALLPGWHRREKEFRAWYENLVDGFNIFNDAAAYQKYVEVLRTPENVRGYRAVRWPKMEEAMKKSDDILKNIGGSQQKGGRGVSPTQKEKKK